MNLPFDGFHNFTHWLEHTLEPVLEHAEVHMHIGEFNPMVAGLSTVIALAAIGLAWLVYNPKRYQAFMDVPRAKRGDDPLRQLLGPVFEALNQKWWVDELYWAVVINPYIALSKFLADQVDWVFWHDWFHDKVLVGVYNGLSQVLSVRIDLGIIDAFANGLGTVTQRSAASLRRVETGYVRNYALAIFLGVVVIVGYLMLR